MILVTNFSFVIYTPNWYTIIIYQTLQHVYLSLSLPPLYRSPCYGCPAPQGEYVPTPYLVCSTSAIENRNAHSTHSKCGGRAYFNHQTWWHTTYICQSHVCVHATSCSSLHKCVHMHPNHLTLPPLDCSTVAIKAPLGETSGLCSLAVPCVVSPSTVGSQRVLCVQLHRQD